MYDIDQFLHACQLGSMVSFIVDVVAQEGGAQFRPHLCRWERSTLVFVFQSLYFVLASTATILDCAINIHELIFICNRSLICQFYIILIIFYFYCPT